MRSRADPGSSFRTESVPVDSPCPYDIAQALRTNSDLVWRKDPSIDGTHEESVARYGGMGSFLIENARPEFRGRSRGHQLDLEGLAFTRRPGPPA